MTAAPSVQPAAPLSPFAEPTRRVPGVWIAAFATAWLGIWMAQLVPIQLLLPLQVQAQLTGSYWVDSVVAFGVISAIAGVCALVAYPLAGALSDRTTSRFGRRRPWILFGALIFAVGLLLLGLQHSLIGVGVFWCVALIGFCVLSAALTATISDQVPVGQRGLVSAWISAPQAVGLIVGLLLVTSLALSQLIGYALMALIAVLLVLPFLFVVKDAVLPAEARVPFTMSSLFAGFWISPRKHPDFGWTLLGRILVNLGNALGTTLLLYFIMFGLHREKTRSMQRASARELAERRGAAVAAVREVAELEVDEFFVNGGGTGSIESTHADPSVTEIAAGSGLFGPHLFDGYVHFSPAPAAAFALGVVRRPAPDVATLLGGGWIASGPPGPDRLPQLAWPPGLRMLPREAAGEVQTPVTGAAARDLTIGDRVWMRHTKAGELAEHVNEFALIEGGAVVATVPSYRGEGKAFL